MSQERAAIEVDENGNYDSPALQTLYGVWEDYDEETVESEEVLRVIGNIETYVQSQIEEMERTAESPDVDRHEPNRVVILDGFYDHLRGLEKMRESFESDNEELIEQGFEMIHAATNQMVLGFQGLVEVSEHSAPKVCIQCSRENPQDASYCRRCGVLLPSLAAPVEKRVLAVNAEGSPADDEEAETTPNYIEVSEAHEAWLATQLSSQDFLTTLTTVRDRQAMQVEQTAVILGDPDQTAESQLALEQLTFALESSLESLESMAQALESGQHGGVEQGMTQLANATIELLQAQKSVAQTSGPNP